MISTVDSNSSEEKGDSLAHVLPETETAVFRVNTLETKLPHHFKVAQVENDIIFPKLCREVSDCKCLIDIDENAKHWDKAKRKTNPYELVHIIGTNNLHSDDLVRRNNIENYSPLSRAFFKMLEIYDSLRIIPDEFNSKSGAIAHLAEGPGGFMEAVYKRRKADGHQDDHFGITLYPKNRNIPGWSQLHRRKTHPLHNPKVRMLTGDLYKTNTILNFAKHFRSKKAFLVTCDGGFDYSKDFNNQERNSWRIIFAEIVTGLLVQKKGGTMVCKMFDLFTHFSLQMIYILTALYKDVYIFKPRTSRPANSEKYVIAKGFKGITKSVISSMLGMVQRWEEMTTVHKDISSVKKEDVELKERSGTSQDRSIAKFKDQKVKWLHIIVENLPLPETFVSRVREINETLADQQKRYIELTLEHIKGRGDTTWKETQVRLARDWFTQYRVFTKEEVRAFYHQKKGTLRDGNLKKQT